MINLTEAKAEKEYTIKQITAKEPIRARLLSFGFAKGNKITVLEYTLTKQTYDVVIEDSQVALRKEEAESILVEEAL